MAIDIQNIPERIREYFSSPRVIAFIADINKRSGFYNIDAIPELLFQLETKELLIKDFISALAKEIPASQFRAKAISREIKEKILEPKRHDLESWGINLNEFDVSDAKTLEEIQKEDEEFEKQFGILPKEETISLEEIIEKKEETLPLKQIKVSAEEKPAAEVKISKAEKPLVKPVTIPVVPLTERLKTKPAPFILQQERPLEQVAKPIEKKSKPFLKTFSLPFQLFKKVFPKPLSETVKAEVSSPETILTKLETLKSKIETPPKRIVHYSEFRTPLNTFEKPFEKPFEKKEDVIVSPKPILEKEPVLEAFKIPLEKLAETKPAVPKPEVPKTEAPKTESPPVFPTLNPKPSSKNSKDSQNQVKVEGNIIDLR